MVQNKWRVHKFGGSSLADASCFRRVADILLSASAPGQVVVVSAMGGMTDALLDLVAVAEHTPEQIAPRLEAIGVGGGAPRAGVFCVGGGWAPPPPEG